MATRWCFRSTGVARSNPNSYRSLRERLELAFQGQYSTLAVVKVLSRLPLNLSERSNQPRGLYAPCPQWRKLQCEECCARLHGRPDVVLSGSESEESPPGRGGWTGGCEMLPKLAGLMENRCASALPCRVGTNGRAHQELPDGPGESDSSPGCHHPGGNPKRAASGKQ